MSKKKNGVLQFTAEDCRKKSEQLKERCDYSKIAKAIGEINTSIKEHLTCGQTKVRIGRIFNDNLLPVLIYSYNWGDIRLSNPEWHIIVQQLNDDGFTVKTDKQSDHITLSW